MTLLEKASKIRDLRLEVIEARCQMLMCSLSFFNWKNCYDKYIEMINSEDSEIRLIAEELGSSLSNASISFLDSSDRENFTYLKSVINENLDASRRVLRSNR